MQQDTRRNRRFRGLFVLPIHIDNIGVHGSDHETDRQATRKLFHMDGSFSHLIVALTELDEEKEEGNQGVRPLVNKSFLVSAGYRSITPRRIRRRAICQRRSETYLGIKLRRQYSAALPILRSMLKSIR